MGNSLYISPFCYTNDLLEKELESLPSDHIDKNEMEIILLYKTLENNGF